MTTPNKLSFLRIALIPVGLALLASGFRYHVLAGTAVFAVACFTDWLDGRIARASKKISKLGAFLDPLADKLLVATYVLTLQAAGWYPLWLVLLAVCGDMLSDALRNFGASQNVSMPANPWGKWKTTFQMASLLLSLGLWIREEDFLGMPIHILSAVPSLLLGVALVFGTISIGKAAKRYRKILV